MWATWVMMHCGVALSTARRCWCSPCVYSISEQAVFVGALACDGLLPSSAASWCVGRLLRWVQHG